MPRALWRARYARTQSIDEPRAMQRGGTTSLSTNRRLG